MGAREIAGAAGLWCALAAPAHAQAPAEAGGDLIQDPTQGIEFRLPKGATRDPEFSDAFDHAYVCEVDGQSCWVIMDVRDIPPEAGADPLDTYINEYRDRLTSAGIRGVEVERGIDPKSGSHARVRGSTSRARRDGGGREAVMASYFYAPPGRLGFVSILYYRDAAATVLPALRTVLFSFRITKAADDRCDIPADATRTDTDTFTFLVGKGAAAAGAKRVQDDCDAALALARTLTGGPTLKARLKVHVHADAARVKKAAATPGTTPAALYVPEGRLVLATSTATGGTALADRCEAVLDAYCDAWLGTPYGRPPWLAMGLRECARAAKAGKEGLVADLGASRHAGWIRKNARKATWQPLRAFLQAPPGEFLTEKPERPVYAMGLLLAAARSADEPTRTVVPRFCAEFLRHRDPDLALDDVLKGVDLDALDKATRDLLAKG